MSVCHAVKEELLRRKTHLYDYFCELNYRAPRVSLKSEFPNDSKDKPELALKFLLCNSCLPRGLLFSNQIRGRETGTAQPILLCSMQILILKLQELLREMTDFRFQ